MTESTNQGLLNIREAARYLGISHHTLYKLLERREVPAAKIGGSWRFNKGALDDFVSAQSLVPRPRIVVIDSDREARNQLADFASARAGDLDLAGTAEEAIRLLGRNKAEIIFLAAQSAKEVADALDAFGEAGIESRICLVVSPADAKAASTALERGPLFMLPKPTSADDVMAILTLITH